MTSRTRIVLETSDQRKSAMVKAASLQGTSLVDWLEENIATVIPNFSDIRTIQPKEISSVNELEDIKTIFETLSSQDWSFTKDDTRYLTHDLHPYPAKFIPQIPANLIARLSMPGDVIIDPFGGSATTAVEAVRLGRRAVSFDANPLSALIGRVKTGFMTPPVRADLEQLCAAVEGHIMDADKQRLKVLDSVITKNQKYLPNIPNIEKWFEGHVIKELCLLRYLIDQTTEGFACDAAQLALSRIIIRVSNQESETRYVSVPRDIPPSLTLRAFLESLKTIIRRLETAAVDFQFADARFLVGDSRHELLQMVGENSADLIVTSPPYPNATDYHLYHRFRLFWLGFDPAALGQIEIGSHLRHQRNNTGFEEYCEDMTQTLKNCSKILMPGRYAVFVVGDAQFKGENFSTSDAICAIAHDVGFDILGIIDRPVHKTKRSFAKPARRARFEQIVVLKKPNKRTTVYLNPPTYRMWAYEQELREREIGSLVGAPVKNSHSETSIELRLRQPALWQIRRLTFTQDFGINEQNNGAQPTWQKVLENGDANPATRKDPKYATHGLHPFKGKFYPQLAKSLMNISGSPVGGCLFDPYCGSGTTLLEGMLNGYAAHGCDLNPLSAKIAHAKTSILSAPRHVVDLSIRAILDRVSQRGDRIPHVLDQFGDATQGELLNWFPKFVLYKLNWLLSQIRLLGEQTLIDFFEIIVSSLVREVSHQDPTDLRIRRRKQPFEDAPVLEIFQERLKLQHARLQKYWSVAGRQPSKLIAPNIICGDSRQAGAMQALGLGADCVDCVVTSPPYATALPYIDTDRLSLLAIMGILSRDRSYLEKNLTGSREILRRDKQKAEEAFLDESATDILPSEVVSLIRDIYEANRLIEVGFRRANMPALLWRYFTDMKENLLQIKNVLKSGTKAFYVVGDSRTHAGGNWVEITTCQSIRQIGEMIGLNYADTIHIDVTRENYKHIKNAITKNQIIIFEKT